MPDSAPKSDASDPRIFATTHWSAVLAAGQGDSLPALRALETLCRGYWYPIYVYVRRKGHGPDDAEDLTQGDSHTSDIVIIRARDPASTTNEAQRCVAKVPWR